VSWEQVGEPSQGALVAVEFVSESQGFGLTTLGNLVESTDGGSTWSSGALTAIGSTLCFPSDEFGYVADSNGDVYATSDGGSTWSLSAQSGLTDDLSPFWSQLSCAGDNVWLGVRVLDPSVPSGEPYVVTSSYDDGKSWSTAASNSLAVELGASAAPTPVDHLACIIGTDSGSQFIVGVPDSGWSLDIQTAGEDGTWNRSTVPSLETGITPPPDSATYLAIHGASFVGNDGWIFVNDNAVGTIDAPGTAAILLETSDGGKTWKTAGSNSSSEPASPG
jgi:photosystem II stability/assembly factor-like uncharacterized protein